ncbi:Crp/Fnr family transcriptional regulator [Alkalihalobacillus sp. MEB130]|uniref:Crp/Fnr family transcriptional regulator n=1 Tax=Alkalihalobacillus sp. MEB130 TaxID=2976704 RepID=UPI0028DE7672|nr:Crp/Fnr family transcriptional regulator [Alkalihalobacillus sp. MEB130]MDT8861268.1 Crp/Fnr family transcriptional regulator [Alkalihalobacillus sp. MEB130]
MGNHEQKMVRFFQQLSTENQQMLLSKGTKIQVQSGSVLFSEGDAPKYIYLVLDGLVRLSKMTSDGKEFSVSLIQKDELVGETGLFNELSVAVTATVEEDALLVRYERTAIEKLFMQNGELAVTFMKWSAIQNQSTQSKFRDLILCGKKGGLYSTLIRFSNSYGVPHEKGIIININLTNVEIANYIGTTREGVNRMMNELKKEEIIYYENNRIVIKDLQFLKDFLQCGDCPVEICTI